MTKLYHDEGAWTVPGAQGKNAARVDVPNAPAELAAWLNDRRCAPPAADAPPIAPAPDPERVAPDAPNDAGAAKAIAAGADAIADWILDQARPADVERLFGALGARFHEQRKGARG